MLQFLICATELFINATTTYIHTTECYVGLDAILFQKQIKLMPY